MIRREFAVGERVLLQLGVDGTRLAPRGLLRWDGCQFRVSKVKLIKIDGVPKYTYYELMSCKSAKGIPYALIGDWLVSLEW